MVTGATLAEAAQPITTESATTATTTEETQEKDNSSTTATTATTDAKSPSGATAPVPISGAKKAEDDIRYHPKYALAYRVIKYNELYHVVERLGSPNDRQNLFARTATTITNWKRQLPLLLRFTKEITPELGPGRIAFFMVSDFLLTAVVPALQTWSHYRLGEVVIEGIRKRQMNWLAWLKAVGGDIGGYALQKAFETRIEDNKAKLAYRYNNYVRERIIEARFRLDSVTSANEKTIGQIRSAQKLLANGWDNAFVLTLIGTVSSHVFNLVNNALMIRKVVRKHGHSLALLSLVINLVFIMKREIGYLSYGSRAVTAITDPNFRRSDTMDKASHDADAQDQILGLRDYYYQEYKKAREAVGEASAKEPDVWSDSGLHPWRTFVFKIVEKTNRRALYLLFAMHAIKQPLKTVVDASTVVNDLSVLDTSSAAFGDSIYYLFRYGRQLLDTLIPLERFYSLDAIKPILKREAEPQTYKGIPLTAISTPSTEPLLQEGESKKIEIGGSTSESGHLAISSNREKDIGETEAHGMGIEFVKVSFTYPHKVKKALDNVSFKILPGQLCSIVGFSGSGKSTLISLLVRLQDPDEGQIYINGIDIRKYDPDDLYRHISMLFQTTKRPDFTIREFVRLGRLDATDEEIEQAIKDSGAEEIIRKLPKGLDTELAARHLWDKTVSVEMLVKRAQQSDEQVLAWRGRNVLEDEVDKDSDDSTTDEELRLFLDRVTANLVHLPLVELDLCTQRAARCKLPAAPVNEEAILSEDYDPKKAEEEEKKNQTDSAEFSGGEWSKVVLARSFLRNSADLLILDEFSASLDPLSEADIFDKFMKRRGLRTMIAVTHRFHLAYRSDLILFMEEGQVKEQGSHHDLMKLDGKYRGMYLKTTNTSGKSVACQTGEEAEQSSDTAKVGEEGVKEKESETVSNATEAVVVSLSVREGETIVSTDLKKS